MSEPQYAPLRAILAEIERKCAMDKDPVEIYDWLIKKITSLGANDDNAELRWVESFDWYDELLAKRDARAALPESERVLLDWPWASWNSKIDPLEPGMLAAITAPDGQGKCLGRGTKIVMHDGTLRAVEDIKIGDVLMGPDSQPRRVLKLGQGREMLYWVRQNAGIDYRANGSHILALLRRNEDGSKTPVEMTIDEVQRLKSGYLQRYIQGYKVPVEYPEQAVPLDPYFLGLWLGDGSSYSSGIYNPDPEIIEWLRDYAAEIGCGIKVVSNNKRDTCQKIMISNGVGGYKRHANTPSTKLKDLGLLGNKHIPHQYLANSREMRLRLLAGLLDSDGSYAYKGFEITQKREDLAYQIKYLADSLGFRTHIKAKRATIKDRGFECTVWRVTIHGDMTCVPMKVERKKPAERIINKDWRVTGIKIEPAGVDDFFGFVIDGDGLFLLEDMTVTHNTILVEMIAEWWAKRKLKVVFVHYELNRALMMDRRTARHTSIEVRTLKSGTMTQEQRALVNAIRPKLLAWNGEITYLHTPGWTVDQTVAELRRQHAEGRCDVVVIDYLEKIAPSKRQMDIFGSNIWQREGDNVEQFKNFAEITEVPVVMVAQMNKAGKDETYKRMSRNDMGGSAEKSNKANLVVLVKRDRDEDTGEYSNIMHVEIDKNTMGATGAFDQIMEPKFFRLTDIYREPLNGK